MLRPPVRVLHAGDGARLDRPADLQPRPDRGRDPVGPFGQHLPLHRVREHREGGAVGRRQDEGDGARPDGHGRHPRRQCRAERLAGFIAGALLARRNLAWMPRLSGDVQAVLAVDEVRFQGQEVACVVAEDPYTAHDALQLIEVDYEPLPALVDPTEALSPDAPLVRADKSDNRCYEWEAGEPDATDRAFAAAARVTT